MVAAAQRVVFGGALGAIKRVDSRFDKDFGGSFHLLFPEAPSSRVVVELIYLPPDLDHAHRMLNPTLAGGAFYDLGPYALLWSTLFLYQHPENEQEFPTEIKATMRIDKRTGVDAAMTWVMLYENMGATVSEPASLSLERRVESDFARTRPSFLRRAALSLSTLLLQTRALSSLEPSELLVRAFSPSSLKTRRTNARLPCLLLVRSASSPRRFTLPFLLHRPSLRQASIHNFQSRRGVINYLLLPDQERSRDALARRRGCESDPGWEAGGREV